MVLNVNKWNTSNLVLIHLNDVDLVKIKIQDKLANLICNPDQQSTKQCDRIGGTFRHSSLSMLVVLHW